MKLDFDTKKLEQRIKKATGPKAMIGAGIEIRNSAQKSIKRRSSSGKKSGYSSPGEPPKSVNPIQRIRYRGEPLYRTVDGVAKVLVKPGQYISPDREKYIKQFMRRYKKSGEIAKEKRAGFLLKNSIKWEVNGDSVLIGPTKSGIGNIGAIHELGLMGPGGTLGRKKKQVRYAKRPFMVPALRRIQSKLAWKLAKNTRL